MFGRGTQRGVQRDAGIPAAVLRLLAFEGGLQSVVGGDEIGAGGEGGDGHIQIELAAFGQSEGFGLHGHCLAGAQVEQVAQGGFGVAAALLQGKQAVFGGEQGLLGLGNLNRGHAAVAVFAAGDLQDLFVLLDGFFGELDGFVEIGYLKIGIDHIVDYGEAGGGQILLGGSLLPRLGRGGGVEFAP